MAPPENAKLYNNGLFSRKLSINGWPCNKCYDLIRPVQTGPLNFHRVCFSSTPMPNGFRGLIVTIIDLGSLLAILRYIFRQHWPMSTFASKCDVYRIFNHLTLHIYSYQNSGEALNR